MKVTIYDIATRARVSPATVSKVLNNTGKLLPDTRERVLATVRELNYQPNIAASSLKKKQTYSIGLIVPDITNPYYSALARAVEDEAMRHDYTVLIASTDNDPNREDTQIHRLSPYNLDGYIITTSASEMRQPIERLLEAGQRVVFLDRHVQVNALPSRYVRIATNHLEGGYLAAKHLLDRGHTKITVLSEPLYLLATDERLKGFFQAFRERGVDTSSISIHAKGFGIEAGHTLAKQIIHDKELPTAIFASNDLIAIGAMQQLHEIGLRIPQDISIIGYDDIAMASHVFPPLTTVAQPIAEMGRLAVQSIFQSGWEELGGGVAGDDKIFQPRLVVRNSVQDRTIKP